jgi:hypothetical protein
MINVTIKNLINCPLFSKIFDNPLEKLLMSHLSNIFQQFYAHTFYSMIRKVTNCLLIVGNILEKQPWLFVIKAYFIFLLCVIEKLTRPRPSFPLYRRYRPK